MADQLSKRGGAERVFMVMADAFPGARLITSVFDEAGSFEELGRLPVETLWLNRFEFFRNDPRRAFPLLRQAFERLDLDEAEAVLCSSAGWSHLVRSRAPRIVYCHNPPRWFYQTDSYLATLPKQLRRGFLAAFRDLREWDRQQARTAARYLVNSTAVAARVRAAYGIESTVLHPPVSLPADARLQPVTAAPAEFFLTIGRPRGYKNTGTVCEVFAERPDLRLVVVGGLPQRPSGAPWPANIREFSSLSDAELRWLYARSSAIVTMAEEDFGLTPIEGYSFGRPTLAVRAGGFLDTVKPGVTGEFVSDFSPAALEAALRNFDPTAYDPDALRAEAARYSIEAFQAALQTHVADITGADTGIRGPAWMAA